VLPWATGFVGDAERLLKRGGAAAVAGANLESERARGQLDQATRLLVEVLAAQPYAVLSRNLRGLPFDSPRLNQRAAERAAAQFGSDHRLDAFLLAVLAARGGVCAPTLPALRELGEEGFRSAIYDASLDPALLAAQCQLARGKPTEALALVEDSLRRRPGTLDVLALAAAGAKVLGGSSGRAQAAEAELFQLHDLLSARYALARARLAWGDPEGALAEADQVLVHLPEAGVVHYERARALAALGRNPEAVEAYGTALDAFPGYAFAPGPLDQAVRLRSAEAPDDPRVLTIAAEHALRSGRVQEARQLAARSTVLYGLSAPVSHRQRVDFLNKATDPGLEAL
jgi:tetratricopeptide (TPR) repeat protein